MEGNVASGLLQPAPHEGYYIGSACISFHVLRVGPACYSQSHLHI